MSCCHLCSSLLPQNLAQIKEIEDLMSSEGWGSLDDERKREVIEMYWSLTIYIDQITNVLV